MELIWKRGSHISERVIKEVENHFNIVLPEDYKKVVIDNNNARPSINTFDTQFSKEHVFKKLLSLKKDDIENVYKSKHVLESIDIELFPIANDPAGNLICLKAGKIVYWLHENNKTLYVADSFSDFLKSLY